MKDSGELIPDRRSEGGVRYYDMGKILGLGSEDMPIIGSVAVALRSLGLRGFQPSVPPPCSLLEVLGAKVRG